MPEDILAAIVRHKHRETAARMDATPAAEMRARAMSAPTVRPFAAALRRQTGDAAVIAEMKRRSPSKGLLCEDYQPAEIAADYAAGGAACLSVLTDEKFFGGSTADLQTARRSCDLPVLRKDFMLNEWQIYESRTMGADAILLIAAILGADELRALARVATELGMTTLLETHTADEIDVALNLPGLPDDVIIGINNRDLKSFHTDIAVTLNLLPKIKQAQPQRLAVSESGIRDGADIVRLREAGVDAFLIGETLMKTPKTGLRQLIKPEE